MSAPSRSTSSTYRRAPRDAVVTDAHDQDAALVQRRPVGLRSRPVDLREHGVAVRCRAEGLGVEVGDRAQDRRPVGADPDRRPRRCATGRAAARCGSPRGSRRACRRDHPPSAPRSAGPARRAGRPSGEPTLTPAAGQPAPLAPPRPPLGGSRHDRCAHAAHHRERRSCSARASSRSCSPATARTPTWRGRSAARSWSGASSGRASTPGGRGRSAGSACSWSARLRVVPRSAL